MDEISELLDGFYSMDIIKNRSCGSIMPLEEAVKRLDSLVGAEPFKKEMSSVIKYANIHGYSDRCMDRNLFPFHYVFTIDEGTGLTTFLSLMALIFYHLNLTEDYTHAEIDSTSENHYDDLFDDGDINPAITCGVISVNLIELLDSDRLNLDRFLERMWKERGQVVYVLVVRHREMGRLKELEGRISSHINFHHIDFPPYTGEELLRICKHHFFNYDLSLDCRIEARLLSRIAEEKEKGYYRGIHTLTKLMEELRVSTFFKGSESLSSINCFKAYGLPEKTEGNDVRKNNQDLWKELDSIIGLETVKQNLREIAISLEVRARLRSEGIESSHPCCHMVFSGNPGTGKTTIARILGTIFNGMGLLKKGELVEVARNELIGEYIGQTAPKVKDKVKKALDSVLFIDEAYSLYGGSSNDFGHEAVSTLVKEMEDKRDRLVVILAGYPDEMEKLININPGLRERVPYRIKFPDYSLDELMDIFILLMGKDYTYNDTAFKKLKEIMETARKNAGKNFGNGRFARNLAERLKMKQANRLYSKEPLSREELLEILPEDVEKLYKDRDIASNMSGSIKRIGFRY